ncbi:MFS transporter [Candidatus Roizmanbacteria bacterium]|nr:MFS transporter [Candidatus Roizmanbacteria bacterium]
MQVANKLERRALPIMLFTIFLDSLGFGILFPILPQLIFSIFQPLGYSHNASLILLGWLTGIFPLMQFLATPILGQLSDRFGRKPILGFSLAGTAIGHILFATGIILRNVPLIFFARAFDGLTGGNISVARAVIADTSTPEHRTRNFGLIGAAFGMGFIMGPYLGARLSDAHASFFGLFQSPLWFGIATPFWFAAILGVINTSLLLFLLPETNKFIDRQAKLVWTKAIYNIRKAASVPGLNVIFSAEFLFFGGFTFFTAFLPVQLIQVHHFTPGNVGDFFAFIGICIFLAQGLLIPFVAKRLKNSQVVRFALFGMAGALLMQLLPNNTIEIMLVGAIIACFHALFTTNSISLVSTTADAKTQGETLGIEASVQALAQAIPALIAGYTATIGISTPIMVGSGVVFSGALIFLVFYRSTK